MKPLSAAHQKFAEGIATGLTASESYRVAYPECKASAAPAAASRLLKDVKIQTEVARIRKAAEQVPGSAVLTLAEKRSFVARLVRANVSTLDTETDGDLLAGLDRIDGSDGEAGILKFRFPDKLAAIKLDNDLAGEGSEAGANDALGQLLGKIRK